MEGSAVISSFVREAVDRVRCGFSPSDAVEGVLCGAHVGGSPLTSAERERIEEAVYRRSAACEAQR